MTERQFLARARTIHRKIEELELLHTAWPEEWSEEETQQVAELLEKAKWTIHDVAYPA